ncbi:hypothetical protein BX600DRAFT_518313 [Xylariales sp. PMI_506]|nr:hypothetical protein BX600DRAFT_518313 [Xylariales sp. PMI_506]
MALPSPETAETIRRKMMKYGRYIDNRELTKMHELFLPDVKVAYMGPDGTPIKVGKLSLVFDSLETYIPTMKKVLAPTTSTHVLGAGELHQTGPDEVRATFSLIDVNHVRGLLGLASNRGGGYYHQTWRRQGGDWFVADMREERRWQENSLCLSIIQGLVGFLAWLGVDAV